MNTLLNLSKHWIRNNPDAEIIFTCPDRNDPENKKEIGNILPSFIWDSIWMDKTYLKNNINKQSKQNCFENIEKSEIEFNKYINSENYFYKDDDVVGFRKERNNIYICGKPNINLKELFTDKFKIQDEDINKILIIGDNPETDIKLSNLLNSQSVLILSGILSSKENQLKYSKQDSTILEKCKPNYILNDISELL